MTDAPIDRFLPSTWWTPIDWTMVLYMLIAIAVVCFVALPIMIMVVRQWDVEFLLKRAVRACVKRGRIHWRLSQPPKYDPRKQGLALTPTPFFAPRICAEKMLSVGRYFCHACKRRFNADGYPSIPISLSHRRAAPIKVRCPFTDCASFSTTLNRIYTRTEAKARLWEKVEAIPKKGGR